MPMRHQENAVETPEIRIKNDETNDEALESRFNNYYDFEDDTW